MQIFEKHRLMSFGAYRVMEGTVFLEGEGEVRRCWVEDVGGSRKSAFTDLHTATGTAEALARQDGHDGADGSHGVDSDGGDSGGGDGGGGGNGGD